jgi:uncharacterized Fe-S cluster-containing radical SAM superfamily protein
MNEFELLKIRFEYFYNGCLTFDFPECDYDCKFCFSKEYRKKFSDYKKKNEINPIHFNELNFNQFPKQIPEKYKNLINTDFGNIANKDYQHLLLKTMENSKNYFLVSDIDDFINKIPQIVQLIPYKFNKIRFSGGEILCRLDWFNIFLEKFFANPDLINIKLIIETNGSRYNKESSEIIELIRNIEAHIDRVYLRISLKNPNEKLYQVITNSKYSGFLNALQFGVYCYSKNIRFHFSVMANYLVLDDFYLLKTKLIEIGLNQKIVWEIIKNMEFERLFLYDGVFYEYLSIIESLDLTSNFQFDVILDDRYKNLVQIKRNYLNSIKDPKFKNSLISYYYRFIERTVPQIIIKDYPIFIKENQPPYKIITNDLLKSENSNNETEKSQKLIYNGYEGIASFWKDSLLTRFFFEGDNKTQLTKSITFRNICLLNRIPKYPGIFYLKDFWNYSNPYFFIYALYSDFHQGNIFEDYYVFGINFNPDSHAHTDISRAIPIVIDNKKFPELIMNIEKNQVINLKEINVEIRAKTEYSIKYDIFELKVPFLVLELSPIQEKYEIFYNDKEIHPFLGNLDALYKTVEITNKYYYMNYFIWTGIGKQNYESTVKKAQDYLDKYQNFENTLSSKMIKIPLDQD